MNNFLFFILDSVYVIGGSAHPGYPDLMSKDDII